MPIVGAAKSLTSSNVIPSISFHPQNPDPSHSTFPPTHVLAQRTQSLRISNCKGMEVSAPNPRRSCSFSNDTSNGWKFSDGLVSSAYAKDCDIATLGNLCVDIVLSVPCLPPKSLQERKKYMEELASSPPDKKYWEAGGNCNTAIAAARLGLHCVAIGHVGDEIYGQFLLDVLRHEGIRMVGLIEDHKAINCSSAINETLLCWVLVDPLQRHGFCSRADFKQEPALSWVNSLTGEAKTAIAQSKILFVNGYGFDELSPGLIVSALKYAVTVGTCVFFDPGPRGKSLSNGTNDEKVALNEFLKMSDVLLLTSDEAESLTGIKDPILAGQKLLKEGVRTKWVVVKMGSKGSVVITLSSIFCAPAFKVNVIDTVGCGDSFMAAIAHGFVHRYPLVHTLAIANAVGAATAMGNGAGRNVATLELAKNLIATGELNEDDQFWDEILDGVSRDLEISLLSNSTLNETSGRLNRVAFSRVGSELMVDLENTQDSNLTKATIGG